MSTGGVASPPWAINEIAEAQTESVMENNAFMNSLV
jgi:hypothetical protein